MNDRMWTALLGRPVPLSAAEAGTRLRAAGKVLLVGPHLKRGELLAATPIFRNLRLALPRAELVLVAGRQNVDAVMDSPDLDLVEVTRLRGLTWGPGPSASSAGWSASASTPPSCSLPHPLAFAVYLARAAHPGFTAGMDEASWGATWPGSVSIAASRAGGGAGPPGGRPWPWWRGWESRWRSAATCSG